MPASTLPRHIQRMWDEDEASRGLGMHLVEVSPGRAVVTMEVTGTMVNGHAVGHGGFVFALADSAFAFACNSHGPVTLAHSADIRFLRPVRLGDRLTATAEEVSRSGRRGVYDVQVRVGEHLVATFTGNSTELRDQSSPESL